MSSLKSLYEAQYQFNKSMMQHLKRMERGRMEKRWVINKKDFDKQKDFQNITDQFYDGGIKAWEEVFESIPQTDFQPFGTSPVRNAYWSWKDKVVPKKTTRPRRQTVFSRKPIPAMEGTVVFRRFENLLSKEEINYYTLYILVQALLGFPDIIGYKLCNNKAIIDDNWTVNLKSSVEQDIMMAAFLMGFAA